MIKRYGFLLAALGLLSACSHSSSHKISSKSSHSAHKGMLCIAPDIYVDPKMTKEQQQTFLRAVKQSKSDISHFFGGLKARPSIYACTTKACFSKFGGIPAKAKAIDDDKVLLSKDALNKVTLTHELAHIEFHKRLGSPQAWNRVPMWFDEGLAVLACKDSKLTKPAKNIPLYKLETQDQWVRAVRENIPAYSIARQAVHKWYKAAGTQGLHSLIKHMNNGKSFSSSLTLSSELQVSSL